VTFFPYVVVVVVLGAGLYGILTSRNLIHMVLSLSIMQSSTVILLLAIGYKQGGSAPIISDRHGNPHAVDPVVQSLTLTDIVVGATVTALLLALVVQEHKRTGTMDPDELSIFKG
jgi:multicomponent Na+:H+ antiporter subunit C